MCHACLLLPDWIGEGNEGEGLTHWPLGDFSEILQSNFQANFSVGWLSYFL